jgi:uncharacterized membrane protein YgcG
MIKRLIKWWRGEPSYKTVLYSNADKMQSARWDKPLTKTSTNKEFSRSSRIDSFSAFPYEATQSLVDSAVEVAEIYSSPSVGYSSSSCDSYGSSSESSSYDSGSCDSGGGGSSD